MLDNLRSFIKAVKGSCKKKPGYFAVRLIVRVDPRVVLSDINSGILSYPLNFLSLMDLYRL